MGFLIRILFAALAIGSIQTANAQARLFEDGDRVCFIGDSITHEGAYHSYVYLYYLTRFPEREIRIWNRGISGDSIWSVLRRFDGDIATIDPTISTVMLGMNDVNRGLYGKDKTDEASIQKQNEQLELYETRMHRLLPKIEALESEIILITPSIYDQTADLEKNNQYGVNDALATCSQLLRNIASKKGYGLIDFHSPMSMINEKQQRSDPTFSIVGADRVHPNRSLGHFIMAYLFLKDQGAPQYVSYLDIDATSGQTIAAKRVQVSDYTTNENSLKFTVQEYSLPFPVTPNLDPALRIVPFQKEFNQQILRIQNLEQGSYALHIDGTHIGRWNNQEFSQGIDLGQQNTPQITQAHTVRELNEKRDLIEREFRQVAFTLFNSGLLEEGIDLEDEETLNAFFESKIEGMEGKSYQGYFQGQFDAFLKIYPELEKRQAEMERLHRAIYEANQLAPRTYSIKKL